MTLKSLQHEFQRSLLLNDATATNLIVDDGRLPVMDRLEIYQQAYRLRLEEALQENFIGLHYLLGDDEFHKLCFAYIDQTPSWYSSVRWYGGSLSEYLRETAPYSSKPMLSEMAEYEWKLLFAFDAREKQSVDETVMASFTLDQWPLLMFEFHPSVQRAEFKWSVVNFHKQVELHEDDPDQVIDPPEETQYPVSWVIWRKGIRQQYRSLDVDEAWAIDQAIRGENFGALCEGICEWVDSRNAPVRAAGFLKGWIESGLLADVSAMS